MRSEIRPDHVAIYIRWSTEDQGDGTTLAVQTEACTHYLRSQGWVVREDLIYIDDGYSGGSLERPALGRLRQAVQRGEVDCVVVFRLDRLSRSVIDTVTLVLQEWADLTHVKSAREPVDTTTAMGRQFFYMLVSYAEWERNVIRERMFGGKLRRAREGRNPGMPAAYGYRRGPVAGALVIDEAEAGAVRLAFSLALQGVGVRRIAVELGRLGHPTRKGGPWGASAVARMLRNPIYTGRLVWGRRRVNPRYGQRAGERKYSVAAPHVDVPVSSVPPIVSPEEFNRVQRMLAGRQRLAPGAAGSEHLLSGLARCGGCGDPLQYNGCGRWTYYRCGGLCGMPSIPSVALEQAVVEQVMLCYRELLVSAVADERAVMRAALAKERAVALAAIDAAHARLAGQERRVNRDYRLGRITADERRALLGEIGAERERLAEHGDAPGCDAPGCETPGLGAGTGSDLWSALAPGEQKLVLRQLLAEVRARRAGRGELHLDLVWVD